MANLELSREQIKELTDWWIDDNNKNKRALNCARIYYDTHFNTEFVPIPQPAERVNGMNATTVLFLVNKRIKAVRVSYEDSGRNKETIKKTFIQDLKVNDYVLVETDTRYNAAVCKVTEINCTIDLDSTEKVGWIFAKIDLKALDDLRTEEERIVKIIRAAEENKRRKELTKTILDNCGPELMMLPSFNIEDEGDIITPPSAPNS